MYPLPPLDVVRDGHRHGNVATEIPHSNPRLRGDWRSASDRAQNPVQCQWWVVLQCEGWWRFEEETGPSELQCLKNYEMSIFKITRPVTIHVDEREHETASASTSSVVSERFSSQREQHLSFVLK
ncbi:hypothetical protein ACQJBY_037089 [Aegilops geniculata]